MMTVYQNKGTKTYDHLLEGVLAKYNKLSEIDKKKYSSYISGAYYNFSCTYAVVDNKPMALTYLTKAINNGFIDYTQIKQDPDLNNIIKL
jgi:hypothetical protein